jgi:DNA replication and repair protein RecF
MELEQLSVLNFKNYGEGSIYPDPHVNIFTGLNGQGKTNLLDAIHYLSFCKSYFNPIDSQNVKHGEDFFVVEGVFHHEDQRDKIYCGVKKGQKKMFKKNKTEYDRLADHIGQFPCVIISPYDKDLISEGSEVRRKFMDSIISQYNRPYLEDLIDYNKVLRQRNSLLKYFWENRTFDADNLEVWNLQLTQLAKKIYEVRQQFVAAFEPIFQGHYQAISGKAEEVSITYRTHLSDEDFGKVLAQSLDKDRRTQYTNVGIHKDDLKFGINGGHPLKKFGSQGQQKTFLIALKLAQFDLVKEATKKLPILLLDDIFDKIDDVRVAHLMKLVSDHNFGQIFITDTHSERIEKIFTEITDKVKVFHIEKGAING